MDSLQRPEYEKYRKIAPSAGPPMSNKRFITTILKVWVYLVRHTISIIRVSKNPAQNPDGIFDFSMYQK